MLQNDTCSNWLSNCHNFLFALVFLQNTCVVIQLKSYCTQKQTKKKTTTRLTNNIIMKKSIVYEWTTSFLVFVEIVKQITRNCLLVIDIFTTVNKQFQERQHRDDIFICVQHLYVCLSLFSIFICDNMRGVQVLSSVRMCVCVCMCIWTTKELFFLYHDDNDDFWVNLIVLWNNNFFYRESYK